MSVNDPQRTFGVPCISMQKQLLSGRITPCLPNDFELRHLKASSEELADHGIKAVEEIGDHYARKLDNPVCQKLDFQHENYQLFAD